MPRPLTYRSWNLFHRTPGGSTARVKFDETMKIQRKAPVNKEQVNTVQSPTENGEGHPYQDSAGNQTKLDAAHQAQLCRLRATSPPLQHWRQVDIEQVTWEVDRLEVCLSLTVSYHSAEESSVSLPSGKCRALK